MDFVQFNQVFAGDCEMEKSSTIEEKMLWKPPGKAGKRSQVKIIFSNTIKIFENFKKHQ